MGSERGGLLVRRLKNSLQYCHFFFGKKVTPDFHRDRLQSHPKNITSLFRDGSLMGLWYYCAFSTESLLNIEFDLKKWNWN